MVGIKSNLVDTVWRINRPDRPKQPIIPLEMKFTGKSWEDKVEEIQKQITEKPADILVLSALDNIAWLLNLRGSDIQFNPVFFSYVAITLDKVYLFVDKSKVKIRKHFVKTNF